MRGSGKGGQNRNKLETAVRATHRPSGIVVRIETERKQAQNKRLARALILSRLHEQRQTSRRASVAEARKHQAGSGMRGDKVRTIRMQDGKVTCHVTGNRTSWKKYSRGDWSDLGV